MSSKRYLYLNLLHSKPFEEYLLTPNKTLRGTCTVQKLQSSGTSQAFLDECVILKRLASLY